MQAANEKEALMKHILAIAACVALTGCASAWHPFSDEPANGATSATDSANKTNHSPHLAGFFMGEMNGTSRSRSVLRQPNDVARQG